MIMNPYYPLLYSLKDYEYSSHFVTSHTRIKCPRFILDNCYNFVIFLYTINTRINTFLLSFYPLFIIISYTCHLFTIFVYTFYHNIVMFLASSFRNTLTYILKKSILKNSKIKKIRKKRG